MVSIDTRRLTLASLFIYIIIFSTATSSTLNRIGQVLVLGFGGLYCLTNGLKIRNNTFLSCMFLYGIMLFISKTYSATPADRMNIVLVGYISMFLVIFFMTQVVTNEEDIKLLLKAFVLASLVQSIYMFSVYGLNMFRVISESEKNIRVGDAVSNSNSVGITFALGAVISLYFLLYEKMPASKKTYYGAIAALGFVFGLLSGSRKALLLLFAGGFFLLLLKNTDKKNIIKSFFGILSACLVLVIMSRLLSSSPLFATINDRITDLIEGLKGNSNLDHSSRTRFTMIDIGWKAFLENPIFGKGVYSSYNYFGTYSHNNFIEVLMNTGLIGFLLFYWPYIITLLQLPQLDRSQRLYPLMVVLFFWVFLGGYGMVNYYSKDSMALMALVCLWLSLQRSKTNAQNNQPDQAS